MKETLKAVTEKAAGEGPKKEKKVESKQKNVVRAPRSNRLKEKGEQKGGKQEGKADEKKKKKRQAKQAK